MTSFQTLYKLVREACRENGISMETASKYLQLFSENKIITNKDIPTEFPKEVSSVVEESVLSFIRQHNYSGIRFESTQSNYLITPNVTNLLNSTSTVHIEIVFNSLPEGGCLITELGSSALSSGHHDSQIEVLTDGKVFVRVWPLNPVCVGTIQFSTWNTVSLVYDSNNSTQYGYLNGVKSENSASGNRGTPFPNHGLFYGIGAKDTTHLGNPNFFNGGISRVSIWKDASGPYKSNPKKNLVLNYVLDCKYTKNNKFIDSVNQIESKFHGNIKIFKKEESTETNETSNKFQMDIGSLLNSKIGSDVKLIVDGVEFDVHKSILSCRSEYFHQLFYKEFLESKSNKIQMDISKDSKAFKECLEYIYSNKFPILSDPEHAFQLYLTADSLLLKELASDIASNFQHILDVDNFESTLLLCSDVECQALKEACVEYLRETYQSLCQKTNYFEKIKNENPQLLQEIIKASIKFI
jgi:hypothetical protein